MRKMFLLLPFITSTLAYFFYSSEFLENLLIKINFPKIETFTFICGEFQIMLLFIFLLKSIPKIVLVKNKDVLPETINDSIIISLVNINAIFFTIITLILGSIFLIKKIIRL